MVEDLTYPFQCLTDEETFPNSPLHTIPHLKISRVIEKFHTTTGLI